MICEECGETNRPGTQFCLFCGAYLAWQGEKSARSSEPSATTERLPTVPGSPTVRPDPPASANVSGTPESRLTSTLIQSPVPPISAPISVPGTEPGVTGHTCPACGAPVESSRRFCPRCGHQLAASPQDAALSRSPRSGWWSRRWNSRDRAARRSYRKSLPRLYRWRRWLIGLLVLALVGGGVWVAKGHPKQWAVDRWHDLRNSLVLVPTTVTVDPASGTLKPSQVKALVDGTSVAWMTPWNATMAGEPGCRGARGAPTIVLKFQPIRIRQIIIWGGLDQKVYPQDWQLEFRPKDVGVSFGPGDCHQISLGQAAFETKKPIDSRRVVTSARIYLDTAWPGPDGGPQILSITEIRLKARPK